MNFDRLPLSRRQLLKLGAASTLAGLSAPALAKSATPEAAPAGIINAEGKRILPWSNWSGNQHCQPADRFVARNESALIKQLKSTTGKLRVVGSGHSFSGLVPTDELLVSLARMRGIVHLDAERQQVTLGAGTRLAQLGEELWSKGFSTINLSDIDSQTWAGAVATSTHGTGRELQSLSSHMSALKLLTSDFPN